MLAIGWNASIEEAAQWVKDHGLSYPVLADPDGSVTFQYTPLAVPWIVIIDHYMEIRLTDAGAAKNKDVSMADIINMIEEILDEPPLAPTLQEPIIDGSDLLLAWSRGIESDLAGYTVHWGGESGSYVSCLEITDPNVTDARLEDLDPGLYYLAVTAFDGRDNISDYSNEKSATVPSPTPTPTPTQAYSPPRIHIGGYYDTRLVAGQSGDLFLFAKITDEDNDIDSVEIYFQEAATGIYLNDSGEDGDWAVEDDLYSWKIEGVTIDYPLQALLEIRCSDWQSLWADSWPWLTVK